MKHHNKEHSYQKTIADLLLRKGLFSNMDYRSYSHDKVHTFTHNHIKEVATSDNILQIILFLPLFLYSFEFDEESSISPEEKDLVRYIVRYLINKINFSEEALTVEGEGAIDPDEKFYLLRLYNQLRYLTQPEFKINPSLSLSRTDLELFNELKQLILKFI